MPTQCSPSLFEFTPVENRAVVASFDSAPACRANSLGERARDRHRCGSRGNLRHAGVNGAAQERACRALRQPGAARETIAPPRGDGWQSARRASYAVMQLLGQYRRPKACIRCSY
jgi:hypothetical protein